MSNTTGTFYYLAVGDTVASNLPSSGDYLDLMDHGNGQNGYLIKGLVFTESKEVDPLAPKVKYTLDMYAKFVLHVRIFGQTADQLQANVRALDLKFRQARLAQGPQPQGTGVCFWQREQGMTQFTFWDVVDGQLGAVGYQDAALVRDYTLTLDVLPFGHGVPGVGTVSGTITNGLASVLYVPAITGDVPALGQLTLTDVSTSTVVINGWTVGARSQPAGSMLTTDYTPIQALTPASPGTAHTDATAISGSAARVTASGVWQTVATVVQPSGTKQTGFMDTTLRLKDATAVLGAPGTPTAVPSGTGGNLSDGVYQYVLTTYDGSGNESAYTASTYASVPVTTLAAPYYFNGAETGDTSGWDAMATTGAGQNTQGTISVTTGAAYTGGGNISSYGFHAIAANGGGALLYKAIPGGGNTATVRYWLRIVSNTTSGANRIPFITSGANDTVWLQSSTLGWKLTTVDSNPTTLSSAAIPLSEGDWVKVEIDATWNGSNAYTYTVYISDVGGTAGTFTAVGGGRTIAGPVDIAIGAKTSVAGDQLTVDFDNVQISNRFIGANTGSDVVTWTAGKNVSGYYLYWNRNGTGWYQVNVGNVLTYTHISNSAGTLKDPPSGSAAAVPTSFKLRYAANTGSATPTYYDGPVFQPALAGNVWEEAYSGALNLPPIAAQDAKNPVPYIVQVQVISTGTSFTTFDVDSLRVRPHRELPQISAMVPGFNLATKRVWVLATNRYGFSSCQLQALPTVLDTFTRANNASATGTTDTGQTYTASGGTFGVENGHFYCNTVTTNDRCYATLTGTANGVIRATLITAGVNEGYIIFRYVDNSNMYMLFVSTAGYRIYQWAAGVRTSLAFNAQVAVAGDQIVLTVNGSTVSVTVNGLALTGLQAISVPNNTSATLVGLGSNSATTEQWDDFSVNPIGGTPVEGTVVPVGSLYLGPGDTKLDLQPIVAGGKSDVVDCKFTAQLTYTPRFRYQRGNA